jgi:hypothetical protein
MKQPLATFFLLALAATAPVAAQARDHHDDRDRHENSDRDYDRIKDRVSQFDSRLDRLAALRDRFGSDEHLRLEINHTANAMQQIRDELRHHDVSPRRMSEQADAVSWSLSHLEEQYHDALSSHTRRRVIYRRSY